MSRASLPSHCRGSVRGCLGELCAIRALTKALGEGVPPAVLHTLPNLNPAATGGGSGGAVIVPAPVVTTISPTKGPFGTTPVLTITGTGFAPDARVPVGDKDATDITVNADGTEITVTVPDGLASGAHDVVVTNPGGGTVTKAGAFTLTGAPINASVTIQDGQPHTGTPVGGSGW